MSLATLQPDVIGRMLVDGHPRALARVLRWQEDADPRAEAVLRTLAPPAQPGRIVGLTGVPGAGKSSLGHRLITAWRRLGLRVAVLAVDPSSPFSGGALLGDRVRMQEHARDADVFLRSVATRGQLGGLSATAWQCTRTLQCARFDRILVETVGVGQDELDIAELADCTLVTLVPNLGDDIQNLKAGLMEIADIFCVNKVDLPGADRFVQTLEATMRLRPRERRPHVVAVSAATGSGLDALVHQLEAFLSALSPPALLARRTRRYRAEVRSRVLSAFVKELEATLAAPRQEARITNAALRLQEPGDLIRGILGDTAERIAGSVDPGPETPEHKA